MEEKGLHALPKEAHKAWGVIVRKVLQPNLPGRRFGAELFQEILFQAVHPLSVQPGQFHTGHEIEFVTQATRGQGAGKEGKILFGQGE